MSGFPVIYQVKADRHTHSRGVPRARRMAPTREVEEWRERLRADEQAEVEKRMTQGRKLEGREDELEIFFCHI